MTEDSHTFCSARNSSNIFLIMYPHLLGSNILKQSWAVIRWLVPLRMTSSAEITYKWPKLDGAVTPGGGATTTGPDATPPPAICQNLQGGGGVSGRVGGGGGIGSLAGGGGGLRATHYYHMHTSRGCLGAWGYRGMYAIIVISCLCQEESLKGLKD